MLLTKKIEPSKVLLIALFIVSFFLWRIPRLGYDEINPDAANWYVRSEQFVVGLKTLDLARTYQHYHPGATLMWVVGGTTEVLKQLFPENKVINHENFLWFHFWTKLVLILVQFGLVVLMVKLLIEFIGFRNALFTGTLLSLEPFFLGNSRIIHLDILMTLFLFISFLWCFKAAKEKKPLYFILCGVFFSAAFLTKSISIIALPFILTWFIYELRMDKKNIFKGVSTFIMSFIFSLFIILPAFIPNFFGTFIDIFKEAERVGGRKGHEQIVDGDVTNDPGPTFYPLILGLKTSPVLILGTLLFLILVIYDLSKKQKNFSGETLKFLFFNFVFFLFYFILMSIFSKKLDRYILPVFPLLALCTVVGVCNLMSRLFLKGHMKLTIVTLISFMVVLPLISFFPHYFTYTNPFFGSPVDANKIVGQKSFGVGIPELRDYLFKYYGEYPNLGFIDTKPMRMIYMNSRLFDIREAGTSKYDVLVLGINENIPDDVEDNKYKFVLDRTYKINNLDYWRIYVKEN